MRPDDKHGPRARRSAARTAWILGGVVVAIYAGALVLGHTGGLDASWEPQPAAQRSGVSAAPEPDAGVQIQRVATAPASAVAPVSSSPSRP